MEITGDLLVKINIAKELGFSFPPRSRILDFGCGSGRTVHELRSIGLDAYGCDLEFRGADGVPTESMQDCGFLRLIDNAEYVLPFENHSFDFVFSDQVFEHVRNYSAVAAEIARVLRSDGMCLNIFPSRYIPIEPHVYVPMSSVIQSYSWLYFWALLGIRNEYQRGTTATQVAVQNYDYLRNQTNYLSKRRITEAFCEHFRQVSFCEEVFLKHAPRGKYLHLLSKLLPCLPSVYGAFRSRVLFVRHPI